MLHAMLFTLALQLSVVSVAEPPMAQTYVQLRDMLTLKCSAYLPGNEEPYPPDDVESGKDESDLDSCISADVVQVFKLNGWTRHDDWTKYAVGIHLAVKRWIEQRL